MRILHTADWHLGRSLCGQSLHAEQEWLFDGPFLDAVRETRPDLLVVAGDIYDRAVPPADSVGLLDDLLSRIVTGEGVPVLLIAGNHDDADRLGFSAGLLRQAKLFIADSPVGMPFGFADRHGPVHVAAANYGHPALVASLLADEALAADHEAAFGGVVRDLRSRIPAGERSILVAHAFVQGGACSDSERVLSVGGSGAVSAGHLAGFDYVALGHLHRPQEWEDGRVRYAGSPLAYSFSEAEHEKSVTLVEIDAAGSVRSRAIALPARRRLRTVRGSFAAVLERLPEHAEDWLQVVLTDRPFDAIARLRERHDMILDLRFETEAARAGAALPGREAARDPLQALDAFWRSVRGEALPEALRPELRDAVAAAVDED